MNAMLTAPALLPGKAASIASSSGVDPGQSRTSAESAGIEHCFDKVMEKIAAHEKATAPAKPHRDADMALRTDKGSSRTRAMKVIHHTLKPESAAQEGAPIEDRLDRTESKSQNDDSGAMESESDETTPVAKATPKSSALSPVIPDPYLAALPAADAVVLSLLLPESLSMTSQVRSGEADDVSNDNAQTPASLESGEHRVDIGSVTGSGTICSPTAGSVRSPVAGESETRAMASSPDLDDTIRGPKAGGFFESVMPSEAHAGESAAPAIRQGTVAASETKMNSKPEPIEGASEALLETAQQPSAAAMSPADSGENRLSPKAIGPKGNQTEESPSKSKVASREVNIEASGIGGARSSPWMKKAEENGLAGQDAGHFVPSGPALAEGSVGGTNTRLAFVVSPGPVQSEPRQSISPVSSAISGVSSQPIISASTSPEISRTRSSVSVEPVQTQISNWAIDIRRTKVDAMEVVLKPNPETEVALRLSLQHGSVDVAAEFKRGDLAGVSAYWPQLQESLSSHGIRLGAITSSNDADLPGRASTGQFNHSDRHPATPELPEAFDPKMLLARAVPPQTRTLPPQRSPAGRAWESWA